MGKGTGRNGTGEREGVDEKKGRRELKKKEDKKKVGGGEERDKRKNKKKESIVDNLKLNMGRRVEE
jgi:hypothetical protein